MTAWLQGEARPVLPWTPIASSRRRAKAARWCAVAVRDLTASEVRAHLDSGKQVSKLA